MKYTINQLNQMSKHVSETLKNEIEDLARDAGLQKETAIFRTMATIATRAVASSVLYLQDIAESETDGTLL